MGGSTNPVAQLTLPSPTLPGVRRFVINAIILEICVCVADRMKRNRIVNSGLCRLPSPPEMQLEGWRMRNQATGCADESCSCPLHGGAERQFTKWRKLE